MSKINMNFKKKVLELYEKKDLIPDEFWIRSENGHRVIWFLDQEDGSAKSYETSKERLGLTRDGQILWGFSSGCSCWSGWNSKDYCPTKSIKEFVISDFEKERKERGEYYLDRLNHWEETASFNLEDFLILVFEDIEPKKGLQVKNAEIRRYLIKRIGYEEIKADTQATIIHQDGTSELLELVINGEKERYVKVKDSSTEREYLLYVPLNIERCKQGIAWTFGLQENEYHPIIET